MNITLHKDKTTPGTNRFKEQTDDHRPLVIYLDNPRVTELGNPETINVTIEKAS